jgi:hypothetical protein
MIDLGQGPLEASAGGRIAAEADEFIVETTGKLN